MNKNPFAAALSAVLIVALIAPATFFIAPNRTHAAGAGILGAAGCIGGLLGIGSLAGSAVSAVTGVPVTNMMIQANTTTSAGADSTSCINDTVLLPLARAVARMILAQITASTINWITGRNGSGQPSFVQNISIHMQGVGDAVAVPFFNQVRTGFNSPFGPVISSALQTRYAEQTSMAGFFAANQSTLARYSPNPTAFVNGDWSKGGIGGWFALTTQTNNNPYILYQTAERQLGSNVGQATTNRRQDLVQGSGFLSWCGASQVDTTASNDGTEMEGVNPGDYCTDSNGKSGTIQTPGSVIHDYTQKAVVNSGIDQLISANDLDAALGAIATALVGQVLGGSGLFGASRPSSVGRPAIVTQLQNYSANNASAAASATALVQTVSANIDSFTDAWNSISTAANTASTTLASLASFCNAAATTATDNPTFASTARAQAAATQTARAVAVVPALTQARSAVNSVAATRALIARTEADVLAATSETAGTSGAAGALSADTQALGAAPPTTADVVNAQSAATVTGRATASQEGSLTVGGGTLIDQMNLISTNAEALKTSVCIEPSAADSTTTTTDTSE